MLTVLFGRKEKVGPMRVGGLVELELQTVYISVLLNYFTIRAYNFIIRKYD